MDSSLIGNMIYHKLYQEYKYRLVVLVHANTAFLVISNGSHSFEKLNELRYLQTLRSNGFAVQLRIPLCKSPNIYRSYIVHNY